MLLYIKAPITQLTPTMTTSTFFFLHTINLPTLDSSVCIAPVFSLLLLCHHFSGCSFVAVELINKFLFHMEVLRHRIMCSMLVSVFGNKLKDPGMQIKVGIVVTVGIVAPVIQNQRFGV